MEYKEATAILCDIERNVAVERVRFGSMAVWPLVRLALWRQLAGGVANSDLTPPSGVRKFFQLARLIFLFLKKRRTTYPGADAVFLVAEGERHIEIECEWASPFSDSLREYADTGGIKAITFDVSRVPSPYGNPISLNFEIMVTEFLERVRRRLRGFKSKPVSIAALNDVIGYLERKYPFLHLQADEIIAEFNLIAGFKRVFLRTFRRVRPKAVFLVCYYQPTLMACVLACRELGIRTVDVQHGQQGDYHGMYANWSNPPPGGYELLPDLFWCWGEQSAERINRWSGAIHPAHRAFVGGNPWMARQIHRRGNAVEEEALDRLLVPGSVAVLIALQPVADPIPMALREAIAKSPQNIQWLVRLHPMMRGGREDEVGRILSDTGNRNVEFGVSSSLLLAGLLRRVDFVVTQWSSVAYEALLFHAHPIIIHENGRKAFESYIDAGLFSYAATAEQVLGIVSREINTFTFGEDRPYIETREQVIRSGLVSVMTASI